MHFFLIASSIAEAHAIVANATKTFLARGTAIFINVPANFPNSVPGYYPE